MDATFDHNGAKCRVAMMQLKNIIVELYEMPAEELAEIKKRSNERIDHIAFDVDDIDATFLTRKENGYSIMEDEPVFLNFWSKGCRYFNIIGPDRERLEFNRFYKTDPC